MSDEYDEAFEDVLQAERERRLVWVVWAVPMLCVSTANQAMTCGTTADGKIKVKLRHPLDNYLELDPGMVFEDREKAQAACEALNEHELNGALRQDGHCCQGKWRSYPAFVCSLCTIVNKVMIQYYFHRDQIRTPLKLAVTRDTGEVQTYDMSTLEQAEAFLNVPPGFRSASLWGQVGESKTLTLVGFQM